MQANQDKLWSEIICHTVKIAIITSVNAKESVYDEINMETDLIKTLNLDSLDAAELIMQIEEIHGMDEIPEEYARKSVTFKDMYDYSKEHCAKSSGELIQYIIDQPKDNFKRDRFFEQISKNFAVDKDLLSGCTTAEEFVKLLPN